MVFKYWKIVVNRKAKSWKKVPPVSSARDEIV